MANHPAPDGLGAYVTTNRLGYGDGITKRFRSLDVTASSLNGDMTFAVKPDDITTGSAGTIKATRADASVLDTMVLDTATLEADRRAEVRLAQRQTGTYATVTLTAEANKDFKVYKVGLGAVALGKR
jgi:hypothetical protein